MKGRILHRRSFLKGVGSTLIALPMLEIMLDSRGEVLADGSGSVPKRFGIFFDGQSLGSDHDVNEFYTPVDVGPGYTLTKALEPLGTWNVKAEVSVVTGLTIPVGSSGGARPPDFHSASHYPQINGMTGIPGSGGGGPHPGVGPGADQLVAEAIGSANRFRSLNYQAQAYWYLDTGDFSGRDIFTFRKNKNGGVDPIVNETSPQAAFRALFNGFNGQDAAVAAALAKRQSILDLVSGDISRLIPQLGVSDQQRITRHLDEIRDLERRISATAPASGAACQIFPDPGADPGTVARYSNEFQRARVFCDLIHMAFVCDLTRAATLMITAPQSHLSATGIFPDIPVDIHEIGHSGNGTFPDGKGPSYAMARVIGWHVDHFAYLISKLKATPEGVGTVLDNCALLFMNEGGQGRVFGEAGKSFGTHSTDNMGVLLAGRAGGLKPGSHIRAQDQHPASVTISAMNAVGLPGGLGEVTGTVPTLFGS